MVLRSIVSLPSIAMNISPISFLLTVSSESGNTYDNVVTQIIARINRDADVSASLLLGTLRYDCYMALRRGSIRSIYLVEVTIFKSITILFSREKSRALSLKLNS